MHYYKRNIGDYAKKCGRLTMLQHGAYTLLIDACYDRETFPTLRDAIDWTWASSKEEVEAVEFVLSRFFTVEDGVFTQKRIADELAQYHETGLINKRIALEREAKRKGKPTDGARSVHGASPDVNEAPPNHKPLTTNHKPLTNNQVESSEPKGSSPRASKKCPASFVVSEELLTWVKAECPLADMKTETATFRDYTYSRAITDWDGAWRNWMRKANSFAADKQKPKAGTPKVYHALNNMNYEQGVSEDGSF